VKLRITLDDKTFEVDVEVAEADHSILPPAYPVGSAQISGHIGPAAGSSGGLPLPVVPIKPGAAVPVAVGDEAKVCRSPVTGIVVKVLVQPGQALQPGDTLLVLEAMKMETHIAAPTAGKVAAVKARRGDNVQAGEVVVELE
jgi:methylmalonyl-CoA carboxyltransferase small subunit